MEAQSDHSQFQAPALGALSYRRESKHVGRGRKLQSNSAK
jgi:hypothetical protein